MRKKIHNLINLLLIMLVLLISVSSCKKDDQNHITISKPVLTTTDIIDITQTTAKSGGNISNDGGTTITTRGVVWSTLQNPTTYDFLGITNEGTGTGPFASNLIGLKTNTTYYVRAYATNAAGTTYGNTISFTTQNYTFGTFTDPRDGYVYKTVTIGTQEWMAENLRYLPSVVGPGTGSQTTPYYYVYYYDGTSVNDAKATSIYSTYGVLYNWEAAKTAAPDGWHLPSADEWAKLVYFLGYTSAGLKLKEAGTAHWNSPNTGATNETGFTALPGGCRYSDGIFKSIGTFGNWWSTSAYNPNSVWVTVMSNNGSSAGGSEYNPSHGYSVRCVRD